MSIRSDRREPLPGDLLPEGPGERALLEARAGQLARPPRKRDEAGERSRYLRVRLPGGGLYGIPYAHLEEILSPRRLTRVPCTPAFVAGVVNRRGILLTVLDGGRLLRGEPEQSRTDVQPVVVLAAAGLTVGLTVEEVEGTDAYRQGELEPPLPAQGAAERAWLAGIHRGEVIVLDPASLLADRRIGVNETLD